MGSVSALAQMCTEKQSTSEAVQMADLMSWCELTQTFSKINFETFSTEYLWMPKDKETKDITINSLIFSVVFTFCTGGVNR